MRCHSKIFQADATVWKSRILSVYLRSGLFGVCGKPSFEKVTVFFCIDIADIKNICIFAYTTHTQNENTRDKNQLFAQSTIVGTT